MKKNAGKKKTEKATGYYYISARNKTFLKVLAKKNDLKASPMLDRVFDTIRGNAKLVKTLSTLTAQKARRRTETRASK